MVQAIDSWGLFTKLISKSTLKTLSLIGGKLHYTLKGWWSQNSALAQKLHSLSVCS